MKVTRLVCAFNKLTLVRKERKRTIQGVINIIRILQAGKNWGKTAMIEGQGKIWEFLKMVKKSLPK